VAEPGPTPDERARARRGLEAAWRWEQEDLTGLAAGLGNAALWDDWRSWPAEHRAALAVAAEDVRRVVATYLTDEGLTAGWSLPRPRAEAMPGVASSGEFLGAESAPPGVPAQSSAGGALEAAVPAPAEPAAPPTSPPLAGRWGGAGLWISRPRGRVLANGVRLVPERRRGSGVVALELYVDAGSLREAKPGVAALTGRLLEEGTRRRTAEELAEAIEDVGGSLEAGATGASVRARAEDLALALE